MKMKFIAFLTLAGTMLCLERLEGAHSPKEKSEYAYTPNIVPEESEYGYTPDFVLPSAQATPKKPGYVPQQKSEKKSFSEQLKSQFSSSSSTKPPQNTYRITLENDTGHKIRVQIANIKPGNRTLYFDQPLVKRRSNFNIEKSVLTFPLAVEIKHNGLNKLDSPNRNAILATFTIYKFVDPESAEIKIFYDKEGDLSSQISQ